MAEITTNELAKRTGASFRQLDYWSREGIIEPSVAGQGSGSVRLFDESIVGKVTLLARLSNTTRRSGSIPLRLVAENYENGYLELAEGITLEWDL